jgi:hypothetical protein
MKKLVFAVILAYLLVLAICGLPSALSLYRTAE